MDNYPGVKTVTNKLICGNRYLPNYDFYNQFIAVFFKIGSVIRPQVYIEIKSPVASAVEPVTSSKVPINIKPSPAPLLGTASAAASM